MTETDDDWHDSLPDPARGGYDSAERTSAKSVSPLNLISMEGGTPMTDKLQELLAVAKKVKPTKEEDEKQRRSFAYGNTNIENPRVTRETIDKEAENLNSEKT
jgi:hypothetical protein